MEFLEVVIAGECVGVKQGVFRSEKGENPYTEIAVLVAGENDTYLAKVRYYANNGKVRLPMAEKGKPVKVVALLRSERLNLVGVQPR